MEAVEVGLGAGGLPWDRKEPSDGEVAEWASTGPCSGWPEVVKPCRSPLVLPSWCHSPCFHGNLGMGGPRLSHPSGGIWDRFARPGGC